jgi:hypothetical protein
MRVYELARELNMHSFDVIDQLNEIDVRVRSPLSGLQNSEVACFRYHAGLSGGKAYRTRERRRVKALPPARGRVLKAECESWPEESSSQAVCEVRQQNWTDGKYEHREQVAIEVLKIVFKCLLWGGLICIVLFLCALYIQLLMVCLPFAVFAGIDKMLSSKPRGRRR